MYVREKASDKDESLAGRRREERKNEKITDVHLSSRRLFSHWPCCFCFRFLYLPLRKRLTSLGEALFISVPGELSKIKPKFSLSLACRLFNLSIIDWCRGVRGSGGSRRKKKRKSREGVVNFSEGHQASYTHTPQTIPTRRTTCISQSGCYRQKPDYEGTLIDYGFCGRRRTTNMPLASLGFFFSFALFSFSSQSSTPFCQPCSPSFKICQRLNPVFLCPAAVNHLPCSRWPGRSEVRREISSCVSCCKTLVL